MVGCYCGIMYHIHLYVNEHHQALNPPKERYRGTDVGVIMLMCFY